MNRRDYSAHIALRDTARMQQVAIARYDAKQSTARAGNRIARLSYCCAMLALSVALFYSATGAA